jgi:pre-mRNA 3'-end-processing factor FIP1
MKGFGRISVFSSPNQQKSSAVSDSFENVINKQVNEELKRLRFSHHRTAFDVDIDSLDTQPWRNKNSDISDYFNYGFNEKTWQVIHFNI